LNKEAISFLTTLCYVLDSKFQPDLVLALLRIALKMTAYRYSQKLVRK
jgi:hypothetical protein